MKYPKATKFLQYVLTLTIGVLIGTLLPKYQSKYDELAEIAKIQAVKIAVIAQASKLANYTQQIQQSQNPKFVEPDLPADPKDVPVDN